MLRYVIALGFVLPLLASAGLLLPPGAIADEPAQEKNRPAWPDVFILLPMYQETYQKPVVAKGENPMTYRQKAIYDWIGGRFEILEITLARDPAFKSRYSEEALKKEKNPPKALEVNKKKAWRWEFPSQSRDIDKIVRRLVVLLDIDKAIIIEQKGYGADLETVAKKFDFAKVEKALANPPGK
jgi:hypothetical protein